MRHPAWGSSTPSSTRQRGHDAVRRIAETLGCPVTTLTEVGHLDTFPDETAELVRLWFKIKDPTVRRTLIAAVKKATSE